MNHRTFLIVSFLAFGVSSWATPVVPGATSTTHCVSDARSQDSASICSVGGANAKVQIASVAAVFAAASAAAADIDGVHGAGAVGGLQYSFVVDGGTPGTIVPVVFQPYLSAFASSIDHAEGFASMLVTTSRGSVQACIDTAGRCDGHPHASFTLTAVAGEVGSINLEADANAGDSLRSESANAVVDPLIFVDPLFPHAGDYTIVLSAGIPNSFPTVPEPNTAALIACGLVATAFRRMRS